LENTIRIGTPSFLSVRPLIFGLTRSPDQRIALSFDSPGNLACALERDALDVALIPAIEYLRGIGRYQLDGPAHVAVSASCSLLLVTNKDIERVQRVAVDEFARTPVAVLRIVLDQLYGVIPDICVAKDVQEKWQERYDALLLSGDQGLSYIYRNPAGSDKVVNLTELWASLTSTPLVLSVWAYNDSRLGGELKKILITSRNLGDQNLSLLSDGIAHTSEFDGQFLYKQFSKGWRYEMGPMETEGLKALEEYAFQYQLIPKRRITDTDSGAERQALNNPTIPTNP
jgi:chorismate dehydratase